MEGALYATLNSTRGEIATTPTDAAFCGTDSDQLVAVGTLDGPLRLFSLKDRRGTLLREIDTAQVSDGGQSPVTSVTSVSAVAGVDGGRGLCAAVGSLPKNSTSSVQLFDVETGEKIREMKMSESPSSDGTTDPNHATITRLVCLDGVFGNGHVVASGDDEGTVALWDARCSTTVATCGRSDRSSPSSVMSLATLSPHTDYVTDIIPAPNSKKAILTTSGDGTLCLIDVRMTSNAYTLKLKHRTEDDNDDELLSVACVRSGQKVVCGTTSGVLNVYSWGAWNDCSDRFPGHPDSVTSVIKVDEGTVVTGSSDGLLRVVGVQPNRFLGVLGEHGTFDIERLVRSEGGHGRFLASVSSLPGDAVKVWDMAVLFDDEDGDDDEGGDGNGNGDGNEKDGDIEDENADDSDDSDGSDGSEDAEDRGKKKRRRKKASRNKGAHKIPTKKATSAADNFFSDLL